MTTLERVHMTPAEFRQLPETNEPTELIDGEVIVSPTPKDQHQGIVLSIIFAIRQAAPTGILRAAPMDVWLGDDCVQPDVFWVSGLESQCKLGEDGYWYGAPDLVIEVLSPSTAHKDRGVKFNRYQQHGVREYWLVDPDGLYVEVYRLDAGTFTRLGAFGPGEAFVSLVLGSTDIQVSSILGSS